MLTTARHRRSSRNVFTAYRTWLLFAGAFLFGVTTVPQASAETWRPRLGLGLRETLSDNVFLSPPAQAKGDLITAVTPSIGLNGRGGRLKLDLAWAPTLLTYLNNASLTTVRQNLNALGTLEAVDEFLFFEARAAIFQSWVNPLGTVTNDQTSATTNRTEQAIVGFSPYIRHRTSSGSVYKVRDDMNFSTLLSSSQSASVSQAGSFTNRFIADYTGPPGTAIVFSADYLNAYNQYSNNPAASLQLARGRLTRPFDPQTSVFLIGGYETNDIVFPAYEGPIYGGGATWSPTPRTTFSVLAEKRFFGTSYNLILNHRTRATSWSLRASQNLQQFGAPGISLQTVSTQSTLEPLLCASIPDPVACQQAVDQFINQNGLPQTVTIPSNFYTNRINLVQALNLSMGLIGVRNSVVFGVFASTTSPVNVSTTSGLPDVFNTYSELIRYGGSVSFSHTISALVRLGGGIDRIQSEGSGVGSLGVPTPPTNTTLTVLRANLTKTFSPKTFGSAALRYQNFDSSTAPGFTERAVLLSVTHTFY